MRDVNPGPFGYYLLSQLRHWAGKFVIGSLALALADQAGVCGEASEVIIAGTDPRALMTVG